MRSREKELQELNRRKAELKKSKTGALLHSDLYHSDRHYDDRRIRLKHQ